MAIYNLLNPAIDRGITYSSVAQVESMLQAWFEEIQASDRIVYKITSKAKYFIPRVTPDFPGAEFTVGPNGSYYSASIEWDGVQEQTYIGLVLAQYEVNGRDDSDFYAVVFEPENDVVVSVMVGSTRFYCSSYAITDLVAGVNYERAKILNEQRMYSIHIDQQKRAFKKAVADVKVGGLVTLKKDYKPRKGAFAGQVIPAGTLLEVKWVGADQYSRSGMRYRLVIAGHEEMTSAPESIWLPQSKVNPVQRTTFIPNVEAAQQWAAMMKTSFHNLSGPHSQYLVGGLPF